MSIRYPPYGPPVFDRPKPPPRPPTLASRYDAALEKGGNIDRIAGMLGVTAAAVRKHIKEREASGWRFVATGWRHLDNQYTHRRRLVVAEGRLERPPEDGDL